jgi:hypothetical protein
MNLHPLLIDRGLKGVASEADIVGYQPMSALPPKADVAEICRHVRFVPKADIRCILALRDNQQNNATDYDGYRSYQLRADVLVLKKYEAQ